jgi:hypothetical protein
MSGPPRTPTSRSSAVASGPDYILFRLPARTKSGRPVVLVRMRGHSQNPGREYALYQWRVPVGADAFRCPGHPIYEDWHPVGGLPEAWGVKPAGTALGFDPNDVYVPGMVRDPDLFD